MIPFNELYVQHCLKMTDAPEAYHEAMSYLVLSSVINRKIWFPYGHQQLFPNLYLLIVGPSTLKRKSWSVSLGRRMIEDVYPGFTIPETSSRQSFFSELVDENRVLQGAGLVHIDELKGFIDRVKGGQWHQGFLQDLSSFYTGEKFRRRIGITAKEKQEFVINDPFINIAACCSFDWLSNSVQSSDLLGGFFSRFLWVVDNEPVTKIMTHPQAGNPAEYAELLQKLHRIKEWIGPALLTPEADAIFDNWLQNWRVANQGGQWDANYDRLTTIARKMALLNAVARTEAESDHPNPKIEIQPLDMKTAIRSVLKTTTAFREVIVGSSLNDVTTRKVAQAILKKSPIDISDLLMATRIPTKQLHDILATLVDLKVAQVDVVEDKDFRNRTRQTTTVRSLPGLSKFIQG